MKAGDLQNYLEDQLISAKNSKLIQADCSNFPQQTQTKTAANRDDASILAQSSTANPSAALAADYLAAWPSGDSRVACKQGCVANNKQVGFILKQSAIFVPFQLIQFDVHIVLEWNKVFQIDY